MSSNDKEYVLIPGRGLLPREVVDRMDQASVRAIEKSVKEVQEKKASSPTTSPTQVTVTQSYAPTSSSSQSTSSGSSRSSSSGSSSSSNQTSAIPNNPELTSPAYGSSVSTTQSTNNILNVLTGGSLLTTLQTDPQTQAQKIYDLQQSQKSSGIKNLVSQIIEKNSPIGNIVSDISSAQNADNNYSSYSSNKYTQQTIQQTNIPPSDYSSTHKQPSTSNIHTESPSYQYEIYKDIIPKDNLPFADSDYVSAHGKGEYTYYKDSKGDWRMVKTTDYQHLKETGQIDVYRSPYEKPRYVTFNDPVTGKERMVKEETFNRWAEEGIPTIVTEIRDGKEVEVKYITKMDANILTQAKGAKSGAYQYLSEDERDWAYSETQRLSHERDVLTSIEQARKSDTNKIGKVEREYVSSYELSSMDPYTKDQLERIDKFSPHYNFVMVDDEGYVRLSDKVTDANRESVKQYLKNVGIDVGAKLDVKKWVPSSRVTVEAKYKPTTSSPYLPYGNEYEAQITKTPNIDFDPYVSGDIIYEKTETQIIPRYIKTDEGYAKVYEHPHKLGEFGYTPITHYRDSDFELVNKEFKEIQKGLYLSSEGDATYTKTDGSFKPYQKLISPEKGEQYWADMLETEQGFLPDLKGYKLIDGRYVPDSYTKVGKYYMSDDGIYYSVDDETGFLTPSHKYITKGFYSEKVDIVARSEDGETKYYFPTEQKVVQTQEDKPQLSDKEIALERLDYIYNKTKDLEIEDMWGKGTKTLFESIPGYKTVKEQIDKHVVNPELRQEHNEFLHGLVKTTVGVSYDISDIRDDIVKSYVEPGFETFGKIATLPILGPPKIILKTIGDKDIPFVSSTAQKLHEIGELGPKVGSSIVAGGVTFVSDVVIKPIPSYLQMSYESGMLMSHEVGTLQRTKEDYDTLDIKLLGKDLISLDIAKDVKGTAIHAFDFGIHALPWITGISSGVSSVSKGVSSTSILPETTLKTSEATSKFFLQSGLIGAGIGIVVEGGTILSTGEVNLEQSLKNIGYSTGAMLGFAGATQLIGSATIKTLDTVSRINVRSKLFDTRTIGLEKFDGISIEHGIETIEYDVLQAKRLKPSIRRFAGDRFDTVEFIGRGTMERPVDSKLFRTTFIGEGPLYEGMKSTGEGFGVSYTDFSTSQILTRTEYGGIVQRRYSATISSRLGQIKMEAPTHRFGETAKSDLDIYGSITRSVEIKPEALASDRAIISGYEKPQLIDFIKPETSTSYYIRETKRITSRTPIFEADIINPQETYLVMQTRPISFDSMVSDIRNFAIKTPYTSPYTSLFPTRGWLRPITRTIAQRGSDITTPRDSTLTTYSSQYTMTEVPKDIIGTTGGEITSIPKGDVIPFKGGEISPYSNEIITTKGRELIPRKNEIVKFEGGVRPLPETPIIPPIDTLPPIGITTDYILDIPRFFKWDEGLPIIPFFGPSGGGGSGSGGFYRGRGRQREIREKKVTVASLSASIFGLKTSGLKGTSFDTRFGAHRPIDTQYEPVLVKRTNTIKKNKSKRGRRITEKPVVEEPVNEIVSRLRRGLL